MKFDRLSQLKNWRDKQAKKEGVEIYRILSNQSLEEIVLKEVKTESGLLEVKGIKEKKLAKYGREILGIMNGDDKIPASAGMTIQNYITGDRIDPEMTNSIKNRASQEIIDQVKSGDQVFSVSVFLDLVNIGLKTFTVKIKGEITSVDARGNVYYFNLKDREDGSVISCLIWKTNYRLAGVELKEGMEIIAHGFPNVYKPSGRLSFSADTIELVGEGALKQQYEELKRKLEKEGLFLAEKKKPVPLFPEKIGLITSRQGEAIFDFRTNLGKFGFQIKFLDSRVEGVQAVADLIKAVRYFKNKDIDVLVLIRGGGSLESLLSFNNEALVREIALFPKPVISGIGHEQDVSLVDLVADRSCSTPTGVAKFLSYSWEQALSRVLLNEKQLRASFQRMILLIDNFLSKTAGAIKDDFGQLLTSFGNLVYRLKAELIKLNNSFRVNQENLKRASLFLRTILPKSINQLNLNLESLVKAISLNDPERQLKLGYGLIYQNKKIIRKITEVSQEDEITLQLQDGKIYSEIKKIVKNDH